LTRCAVLVVDDDPVIVATTVELLAFEGYPVQTATNGAEALEEVERHRPDIVLLDMGMPVMDGWSFVRELHARHIDLQILVMTAARDAQASADAIQAQGFLPKPFKLDQLLTQMERLCAARPIE